jgi:hypothetical protein
MRHSSHRVPDFIKCDVEGAELLLFEGAKTTLDRPEAPSVIYEANLAAAHAFGCSVSASTDFLRRLTAAAYCFYWVQPEGTLVPFRDLAKNVEF